MKLKCILYKADFSKSRDAEVILYNPELNYESSLIPTLGNNAIRTLPRKMKVKIDTGATASEIAVGKRIGAGVAGVANTTPNGVVEDLVELFLENHLKQVDLDIKQVFQVKL